MYHRHRYAGRLLCTVRQFFTTCITFLHSLNTSLLFLLLVVVVKVHELFENAELSMEHQDLPFVPLFTLFGSKAVDT